MNDETKDPFEWRKKSKRFDIGDDDDGIGVFALFAVEEDLFCVKEKNIYSITLADNIDPKRTDPSIPDSKRKVLQYGSDSEYVGRTLLQAHKLFEKDALPHDVNYQKAINISFAFLKEIISLVENKEVYVKEEADNNQSFKGRRDSDHSLTLPSTTNLLQTTKHFITNIDHAARHLMEITLLFYPEIPLSKWSGKLVEKVKAEYGEQHSFTMFSNSMSSWLCLVRDMRNAIEHPKPDDKIEVQDYRLGGLNKVIPPTIKYQGPNSSLQEMTVSRFVQEGIENLLVSFETLIAHLCNVHTVPFAGRYQRSVVELLKDKRRPHETHIRFAYHIDWAE